MKTETIACIASIIIALCATSYAQFPLRIARIENIPDQFVGGEILKVAYSRLNIPIELVDLPAKRALMDSSKGKLDGEVHRNINVQKQYPSLILIRPAINYIEPSVFSKIYRFEVKGWDSIKNYNIGIVRGVGTSEDGTEGMKHVLAVSTLDHMMLMLVADRIDVAVSDSFSGLASVKKLGLNDRIKVLTPPLQKNEIYHFLHEKHRDLVPKVENVLLEMQASGELEMLRKQIIKEYLAQPDSAIHGR
ncbi:MAG: transporter substrate-binding domain-containing protein [Deltaproteobacteria bacterium]|nr:transporter substrate-binding domain-containing protein [Deltaproteobacteria bacterium]